MKTKIQELIKLYQGKSDKCRDQANKYRDRDDIYATYISSAETYDLVINDLNKLIASENES
jgi:hypothetical protein